MVKSYGLSSFLATVELQWLWCCNLCPKLIFLWHQLEEGKLKDPPIQGPFCELQDYCWSRWEQADQEGQMEGPCLRRIWWPARHHQRKRCCGLSVPSPHGNRNSLCCHEFLWLHQPRSPHVSIYDAYSSIVNRLLSVPGFDHGLIWFDDLDTTWTTRWTVSTLPLLSWTSLLFTSPRTSCPCPTSRYIYL